MYYNHDLSIDIFNWKGSKRTVAINDLENIYFIWNLPDITVLIKLLRTNNITRILLFTSSLLTCGGLLRITVLQLTPRIIDIKKVSIIIIVIIIIIIIITTWQFEEEFYLNIWNNHRSYQNSTQDSQWIL